MQIPHVSYIFNMQTMSTRDLALMVKVHRAQLLTCRRVFESVEVDRTNVGRTGRSCHHTSMMVSRRLDACNERRHEQVGEEEVANDVRPPLQVVSLLG